MQQLEGSGRELFALCCLYRFFIDAQPSTGRSTFGQLKRGRIVFVGRLDLDGEAHRVFDRHAGALGEVLQHRMGGVAEQSDPPLAPGGGAFLGTTGPESTIS